MKRNVFFILFFLICSTLGWAQPPIPDHGGKWVVDNAEVLSESTIATVSSLCRDEFDSTSNQVVVYTFKSLEGGNIEQYANEVYNAWEVGSKENNNGVLLIIAIDDRKMRIEVGYGLEPYLTDIEAKDIVDYEIKPEFKKGDFDNGVLKGVQNILLGIRGSYVAKVDLSSYQQIPNKKNNENLIAFIIFGLIVSLITLAVSRIYGKMGIFTEGILLFIFMPTFFIFTTGIYVLGFTIFQIVLFIVLRKVWKVKKPKWATGKDTWANFFKSSGGGSYSSSSYSSSSWSSSSSSSSYSSGGSGGFSGGGGKSGGGGASGDW